MQGKHTRVMFAVAGMMILLAMAVVLAGCSQAGKSDAEGWNYKEGYVVAKENGKILVIRDRVEQTGANLGDLLINVQPNAIWLSVDKEEYDTVRIGDKVSVTIPDGQVNPSYPAKADAIVSEAKTV